MLEPGRNYSVANTNYRYGFNGKENDNDIENGMQDYGMRIYDGRLGRFLNVDPLSDDYPELTPYQFASNSPIAFIDLDGTEQAYKMPDGSIYVQPPSDHLISPVPLYVRENGTLIPSGGRDIEGGRQMSLTLDFIPIVGTIKGGIESVTGHDLVTGERISTTGRVLGLLPYIGKVKTAVKVVKAEEEIQKIVKVEKAVTKSEKVAASTDKAIVNVEKKVKKGNVPLNERDTKRIFSKKQVNTKYEEMDGKCEYCGRKVKREEYRGDHRTAHAKGGRTDPNNLAGACKDCNLEKADKDIGSGEGQYTPPKVKRK